MIEGPEFREHSVPEYRGGLGDKGWQALKDFVDQGGTLISLGDACNLLVDACRCR